jgi:uncharacterized protein YbgA (DUF1722 family)/uncharacterized protein YbbK (DUF523 family)
LEIVVKRLVGNLMDFEKPRIVSSKCIEFEACRYNGLMIKSSIVEKLKDYAEFFPVCPEVGIGLGVPRDPIRIVDSEGKIELFQPNTGKIYTNKMNKFSEYYLESIHDIDGFLLKNKSPSCGVKAINIYTSFENSRPRKDGKGLFASKVMEKYPNLPLEDEGRLRNLFIRENFLTNIFTLAKFRKIVSGDFNDLIKFHTQNKLLLMSRSPVNLNKMGKILSNNKKQPLDNIKAAYVKLLFKTLAEIPQSSLNINVLMHAMGYVSDNLKHDEKSLFLTTLDEYKKERIPLLVCLNMLKMWIIHYDQEYLAEQTFFEPYPRDLMQITFI